MLCNYADAAALDVIQPYLSTRVIHDSNLFRSSPDEGNSEVSETLTHIEAGIKVRYPVSRQHFNLDFSINRNQFQRYEFLSHNGNNGQVVWNWEAGNLWQGDLGYTRSQTLASFVETQARVRDVRTQQSAFASANYTLHPDWRLHWGGRWSDLESGSSRNQFLNRDETSGVLGVDYISNADNSLGLEGQLLEARFPESGITSASNSDDSYSQVTISSVADWKYSGNSHFRGRFGYTQRRYSELAARDFNGMTGRLTYDWSITGKTLLSVAAWREVGAASDVVSTFAVIKGSSLDVSWFPTSKIFVRGGFAHKSYDFRGDAGFVLGVIDQRKDDISSFGASVGYNPLHNIELSLKGIIEERDSTRVGVDYNYKLITADIRINF